MQSEDKPSIQDIYRHRRQFGVNLGAAFVGEKWIADRLYTCAPGGVSSELSAVRAYVGVHGLSRAQQEWENHWGTWFSDHDVTYLSDHKINSVRIPLGFFSLSEPALLADTAFLDYAQVYKNCWNYVEAIINKCAAAGIGVLLDLHCLQGGQNKDVHCGMDNSTAAFFSEERHQRMALDSVKLLLSKASSFTNIVGVQAMNEPVWGREDILYPFYSACLEHAYSVGNVPLYIGDGWNLNLWSKWVGERDQFCIVDHHYYYCFTEGDHKRSPADHIRQIKQSTELAQCSELAGGNIVIGEWSLALDSSSKQLVRADDLSQLRHEFATVQANKYTADIGGCYFWTYKFQVRNNNNEWDLRDMIDSGSIQSPLRAPFKLDHSTLRHEFDNHSSRKMNEHCHYWQSRGEYFEHWRYEEGFALAWNDVLCFADADSEIGYIGEWKKKRRAAHVRDRGHSDYIWEFDTGYAAGFVAATKVLEA
ncbi:protein of unknown function [Taphrina deformans PYCC 5710]|uniref:Glycoside hydrolase family 5 domain-containing protein n=1 Tax=Taphrina deformans (strain PYCC 5710 / ATCC 11124 / CBS 356.35 / IMI 108563 / JCM 9778 / NBRC 8474) TaxID=1097556 RepID=R4XNY7_TAPDE|nr:protein of unknown function [Taphrina deformans PYCC 5710]|eukprot:CCG84975.1 protein of unknown function [Taphrina deformans PYCC 5710]